jgi:hypothetical protein
LQQPIGPLRVAEGKQEEEIMQVIERVPEHYEVEEGEFGRIYSWHPESVVVECGACGARMAFKRRDIIDSMPDCECGKGHMASVCEELDDQLLEPVW